MRVTPRVAHLHESVEEFFLGRRIDHVRSNRLHLRERIVAQSGFLEGRPRLATARHVEQFVDERVALLACAEAFLAVDPNGRSAQSDSRESKEGRPKATRDRHQRTPTLVERHAWSAGSAGSDLKKRMRTG